MWRQQVLRECWTCKKQFRATRSDAATCGPKCRKAMQRKKQKSEAAYQEQLKSYNQKLAEIEKEKRKWFLCEKKVNNEQ